MAKDYSKDKSELKAIGERIARTRREHGGMTQRELADRIGVTERSVQAYEHGKVWPWNVIDKLTEVFGLPASWFLYGDSLEPTEEVLEEMTEMRKEMKLLTRQVAQMRALLERQADSSSTDTEN